MPTNFCLYIAAIIRDLLALEKLGNYRIICWKHTRVLPANSRVRKIINNVVFERDALNIIRIIKYYSLKMRYSYILKTVEKKNYEIYDLIWVAYL